jgi:hypothetical protein
MHHEPLLLPRPLLRLLTWASIAIAPACATSDPAPDPVAQAGAALPPRLTVVDRAIVAPGGAPIVLRGYDWGQWDTMVTGDAAANRGQGATVVRVVLRWWGTYKTPSVDAYDPNQPNQGYIETGHLTDLDATIKAATDKGLWVVVAIDSDHGQGSRTEADLGRDNFWTDPTMKARFIVAWKFLASHYASHVGIGAYEILPEPRPVDRAGNPLGDDAVRAFYDELIGDVQPLAPTTPLVVGPNNGYDLARLQSAYLANRTNVIYTGDYFVHPTAQVPDPNELDRIGYLTAFLQANPAPVWINQVAVRSDTPGGLTKVDSLLGTLAGIHVGWAWWTYREQAACPGDYGMYCQAADGSWSPRLDWLARVGSHLP